MNAMTTELTQPGAAPATAKARVLIVEDHDVLTLSLIHI